MLTLAGALACATAAPKAPPVAPPFRPDATALPAKVVEEIGPPEDCPAADPSTGAPAKVYKDRSIDEGASYADAGLKIQKQSEDSGKATQERNDLLQAAIEKYITALAADPYNVKATYNLSTAYARVGRGQCALNLLGRLVAMKDWPSQKSQIDDCADRIFGRGKKWKDNADPDFDKLRTNDKFRNLVKQF